jgi:membrane protein YdbS with pleckstrin-like domain
MAHFSEAPKPLRILIDRHASTKKVKSMALIECPECGKQVSTEAQACPNCGYPVAARHGGQQVVSDAKPGSEITEMVAEIYPSWWGYFWYLFFFWLIVPPFIAYFHRRSTMLRIYPQRITIERGLLSKCHRDYNPRDIRSIDIDQGIFQRIVGIGDLTISTAASAEASERIESIPDPKGVRDLLLAQRGGG